ncbi:hypothetical protein D3C76_1176910 [compost metagenome]
MPSAASSAAQIRGESSGGVSIMIRSYFSFSTGRITSLNRKSSSVRSSFEHCQYLSLNLASVGNAVITSRFGRCVENGILAMISASEYPMSRYFPYSESSS